MSDFDTDAPSGGADLLAQLGLDARAIRTILEEPARSTPGPTTASRREARRR